MCILTLPGEKLLQEQKGPSFPRQSTPHPPSIYQLEPLPRLPCPHSWTAPSFDAQQNLGPDPICFHCFPPQGPATPWALAALPAWGDTAGPPLVFWLLLSLPCLLQAAAAAEVFLIFRKQHQIMRHSSKVSICFLSKYKIPTIADKSLRQQFSKCGPGNPRDSLPSPTSFRGSHSQNYFYYNTKVLCVFCAPIPPPWVGGQWSF